MKLDNFSVHCFYSFVQEANSYFENLIIHENCIFIVILTRVILQRIHWVAVDYLEFIFANFVICVYLDVKLLYF